MASALGVVGGLFRGAGNQPYAKYVKTTMTELRLPKTPRRCWTTLAVGVGVLILAAGCGQERTTAIPLVTGPCAGHPPGCGSPQGSAAALAAGRWSRFPSGPLSARDGQASVWTGRELLVWGGAAPRGAGSAGLSDGAAYNPSTRTWSRVPPSPLAPRLGATAVWMGTEAMFWGGERDQGSSGHTFADGAAYNPATRTWRLLPPAPLKARTGATAIWDGAEVIVFGGMTANGTSLYTGATYDTRTKEWHTLPVLPVSHPDSAVGATVAWTGTELLVWVVYEFRTPPTGPSFQSSTGTQAFAWKAGSSSWSQIPSPPGNVDTYGANPIWTGQKVLLLGGTGCLPGMGCAFDPTGRGFAFDPVFNVWRQIPSNTVLVESVPETWTGRAVVVLNRGAEIGNGHTAILSPGDGAVYDPETRTWLALLRGPVRNLSESNVAWTGRQLLVWDGGDGSGSPSGEVLTPYAS